jgi:hypothetical protein
MCPEKYYANKNPKPVLANYQVLIITTTKYSHKNICS